MSPKKSEPTMPAAPREPADPIDEYDRMAELFRARTGLLCPGKDYPPDMDDGATEDHRGDAWTVFKAYYAEAKEVAALRERVANESRVRGALVEALTAIKAIADERFDHCLEQGKYNQTQTWTAICDLAENALNLAKGSSEPSTGASAAEGDGDG